MARRGLSQETVVCAAARLIEERGRAGFSMKQLADALGIKSASLYNHVRSMEELLAEVCRYALRLQMEEGERALAGKSRDTAVEALAAAYRRFGKEHRELYWLIMDRSARDRRVLDDAAHCITAPLEEMLAGYDLPAEQQIHFRRFFRALVHGFISQEDAGFFSHHPADTEESFRFAIARFIESLKRAEKRSFA